MENNDGRFNIYKNMDSNTTKMVNCALGLVAGAAWIYAFRTEVDPQILDVVQNTVATGIWYSVLANGAKRVNSSKDVLAIHKEYKRAVRNTAILVEKLQFDDPVQIFGMFTYLLENGYLSQREDFVNTPKNAFDMTALSGASVMIGRANSEGISNFLSDVYTELGFDNSVMMVHSFEEDNDIIPELSERNRDEFVINLCAKYHIKAMAEESIEQYDSIQRQKRFDDRNASFPNHVINVVGDKSGNVYYLDATLGRMYTLKSNNRLYINGYRNRYAIMKNYVDAFHRHPNYKRNVVNELMSRKQESYDENRKIFLASQMITRSRYKLADEYFSYNKKTYNKIYEEMVGHKSL